MRMSLSLPRIACLSVSCLLKPAEELLRLFCLPIAQSNFDEAAAFPSSCFPFLFLCLGQRIFPLPKASGNGQCARRPLPTCIELLRKTAGSSLSVACFPQQAISYLPSFACPSRLRNVTRGKGRTRSFSVNLGATIFDGCNEYPGSDHRPMDPRRIETRHSAQPRRQAYHTENRQITG